MITLWLVFLFINQGSLSFEMNLNTSIDRSLCVRTDIDLKNDNKIIEGKKRILYAYN